MDGDEVVLVDRLRAGDGGAFRELVERHHGTMVRLASAFVPSRAVAEEVVQDSWIAVIKGIDGFEARSTLKTWLSRIVVNHAKRRGERERRTVPLSALDGDDGDEPSVPAERFSADGQGMWTQPLPRWSDLPEDRMLAEDTVTTVSRMVERLPDLQRQVLVLRDIGGWEATEVCDLLGITEGNQRVLLHRARSRVRARLERELGAVG